MDGTFLFGLHLGLTVGVVMAPLLATCLRTGRGDLVGPAVIGAVGTLVLLLVAESVLDSGSRYPTAKAEIVIAGSLSLAGAAVLTWTVYEIRRAGERRYEPSRRAVYAGATVAAAVFSVTQGGLLPAQFLSSAAKASTGASASPQPLAEVALGLFAAAVVGLLLFQGLLRIRPDRWFFTVTTALLAVVTAGVLSIAVNNLQFGDVIGGDLTPVFDVYATVPADSWYGTVLSALFGFHPAPTALQVTVWSLYVVPTLLLLLAPIGFGRSVGGAGAEGKTTDGEADAGGSAAPGPWGGRYGARGGDGGTGSDR
ncbi:FTR1 family protein [Streptomyces sp. NPDC058953]|uniref:FTR1 family protein n=1 Tax=unclassified Streptomyces TaxID=2593676 RepID=UPI0036A05D06